MGKVRFQLAISLDGYAAGPNQSEKDPLGVGGTQLHEWVLKLEAWRRPHGREGGDTGPSNDVIDEVQRNVGAGIMGRNMFGGGPGPWSETEPWRGWWGDEPPFHYPVYVLTHHPREPLEMEGGTTFHFVTEGIESALERARADAGERDVLISGGEITVHQYIGAGLVDEFDLHVVTVLLGAGVRLLENAGAPKLEQLRAIEAPGVTHLKYRVLN